MTIAVAHLIRRFLPGCNCETAYSLPVLLQQLRRKPEAILILCLRPREHLFLFYSLRQILPDYPVMIISDELFFSDRVVLKVYGGIPALLEQELAEILIRWRRDETVGRGGTPAQDRRAGRLFVISGSGDGLSGSASDI